jgi:hypothetical protein
MLAAHPDASRAMDARALRFDRPACRRVPMAVPAAHGSRPGRARPGGHDCPPPSGAPMAQPPATGADVARDPGRGRSRPPVPATDAAPARVRRGSRPVRCPSARATAAAPVVLPKPPAARGRDSCPGAADRDRDRPDSSRAAHPRARRPAVGVRMVPGRACRADRRPDRCRAHRRAADCSLRRTRIRRAGRGRRMRPTPAAARTRPAVRDPRNRRPGDDRPRRSAMPPVAGPPRLRACRRRAVPASHPRNGLDCPHRDPCRIRRDRPRRGWAATRPEADDLCRGWAATRPAAADFRRGSGATRPAAAGCPRGWGAGRAAHPDLRRGFRYADQPRRASAVRRHRWPIFVSSIMIPRSASVSRR